MTKKASVQSSTLKRSKTKKKSVMEKMEEEARKMVRERNAAERELNMDLALR